MQNSDARKLTLAERWLVIFTFLCLGFWLNTFCMAVISFGITVAGPLLCLWAVIAFSMRVLSFIRTKDVVCVRREGKKHFVMSLLAAIFWTVFAVGIWIAFGDMVYHAFRVKSWQEFMEVVPYNAIFITPTVTAIYFSLLALLRWKNRVNRVKG